jgi:hypothetical protein
MAAAKELYAISEACANTTIK